MLRGGFGCLHKSSLCETFRLWLGGQSQCSLWHSSFLLSRRQAGGRDSSSSDSDSNGAELGDGVDTRLKEAAEEVGRSVPKQGQAMQSDLLKQLQAFSKLSKDQASGGPSSEAASKLSNLLSGMQVQKSSPRWKQADEVFMKTRPRSGRMPMGRQLSQHHSREKVKLFDGPGLGIFTSGEAVQSTRETGTGGVPEARASLWEKLHQEQLDKLRQQPPSNTFEEMMQWTQEGKLWQFPINNEQGMEEEAKVGFHQHVFLEDQIRDFPRRGPIRHFMELVLVGLSRNPHLSVQQKHEHIDWFRRYFREKEDVLHEALGQDGLMASAKSS